jgi:hypothetical protein
MSIIARSSIGAFLVGIMLITQLGLVVDRIQLVQFALTMGVEAFVPMFTWWSFTLAICLPEGANVSSTTNILFIEKIILKLIYR